MKDEKKFESWNEVIVDFFEYRVEKINTKQQCKIYRARVNLKNKETKISTEKNLKKSNKLKEEFEKLKTIVIKLRTEAPATEIRQWIDETSIKKIGEGKKIIKATHVMKFSHSSANSDGLYLNNSINRHLFILTSSMKKQLISDIAHNNGALITISRFMSLSLNKKSIIDFILDDNFIFFQHFCKTDIQLKQWINGFRDLIESRVIKDADKAKQLYFPIDKPNSLDEPIYHLIVPLFSSSFAQELYVRQTVIKYGKQEKKIKKQKNIDKTESSKSAKYHLVNSMKIPNIAVQHFGGTQPQNISMLNKDRGGLSYLLSAQPPIWQSQLKPPTYKSSLFDFDFTNHRLREDINYLRDFVIRFKQLDLSIQNPKRRKWIDSWVANIIYELFDYVSRIQSLPSGWSANDDVKLKLSHKLLLDPYRNNDDFQGQRKNKDWQTEICNDFAGWLNGQLIGKDKKFTPQVEHHRMWVQLLKPQLREFNEIVDLDSQQLVSSLL